MDYLTNLFYQLQAENEILKQVVEFYALVIQGLLLTNIVTFVFLCVVLFKHKKAQSIITRAANEEDTPLDRAA